MVKHSQEPGCSVSQDGSADESINEKPGIDISISLTESFLQFVDKFYFYGT